MKLPDLPNDLLVTLPSYLDSIDDLYSLIETCRGLYAACHDTKARFPPRLRKRNGQIPLQPCPHLLIAGTARQVGDWAVQSIENRTAFHSALNRGVAGLVKLCVSVARVSLDDIKELRRIKHEILKPLAELVNSEPNLGRWSDPAHPVRLRNPELCLLNFWTYCDLFRHSITASYRPVEAAVQLEYGMRSNFLSHYLPVERGLQSSATSAEDGYPFAYMIGNRLAYQQLDLRHLLVETAFSDGVLRRLLPCKIDYSRINNDEPPKDYSSPDDSVVDIVRHSGLLTMRFVLLHHSWAAERLQTRYHDENVDAEVELLKQEVLQAHDSGAYRTVYEARRRTGPHNDVVADDRPWKGLVEELEELWLVRSM